MSRVTISLHSPASAWSHSLLPAVLPLAAFPSAAWIGSAGWPAWERMWRLAFAIYASCKWLTWCQAASRMGSPSLWRSLAYLLAWPGMDAAGFLDPGRQTIRPTLAEYLLSLANLALGGAFFYAASPIVLAWPRTAAALALCGIGLLLHCGLFHLLSILWRTVGIAAPPIMRAPILASSVADFWGRRWNLAFRELANRYVYRPLLGRMSAAAALLVSFAISGVIHDLVISLPAGAGFGRPTLYFLLQAAGLFVEHSRFGRKHGLGRGAAGRLFAIFAVIAPLPLLFPAVFLDRVIVPMLRAMAAC